MNNLVDIDNLILALNQSGFNGFNEGQAESFKKALTSSSGYTGYNLEREVKFRLPAYTVLRNRVAVDNAPVGAMSGPQAHYKAQLGYNGFDFGAAMGTAFGGNGTAGNPQATDIGPYYKSQSVAGSVQLEAIDFARGFDDPIKAQSMFNLQTGLRLEELMIAGGNLYALTPPTVTGVGAGTGSIFAAGTWTVKVTALTMEGTLRNATSVNTTAQTDSAGSSIAGSYAGESAVGTASVVLSGQQLYLSVSWPVVQGALGYKVYVSDAYGDSTDVYLLNPATEMAFSNGDAMVVRQTGQAYVTVNSVRIIATPAGAVLAPTADGSANARQYEGYWAWCTKTTMYGTNLTGVGDRVFTDMAGGTLTAEDSGIVEVNDALEKLWSLYHTAPTAIVGSPRSVRIFTTKVIHNNNVSMMLVGNQGGNLQQQNKFIGGVMVGGYTNQFAQNAGMSPLIDIIAHPYMPDGAFKLLSETLPPDTYRFAQDSRCFALDVLRPWNYWPLASTDRNINFDIWNLQTLKCYYPTSQAAIAGFRVDK